jgi:hypothetical protein
MTGTPSGGRFLWAAVVAVGVLMLTLCGSCTAYFAGTALLGMARGEDAGLGVIVLAGAALFGGLPTLCGLMLIWLGRRKYRVVGAPPGPPKRP